MIRRLLCLLALAGCSPQLLAEEIEVAVMPEVPGRLVLPDGGPPRAAVLLLHGWCGTMDEVGDLYRDLALGLAEQGIASLRFDFSGEGPSADYVVTGTYESRYLQASTAYRLLVDRVPDVPVGVNGFSLGGLTAMTLADRHPDWFSTMVLWSAAARMDLLGRGGDVGGAAVGALTDGAAVYETWTDITLTRQFVLSYLDVDASAGLDRYPGSLLAIRGTADYLPALDLEWIAATPGTDDAVVYIDGADHIFDVLDEPRPPHGDRVLAHTVAWFGERL